jgi:hypothetical protein
VRSVGSTPTIFVDSIEKACHIKHDNSRDQCEIELCDGRHIVLSFHLFAASELRNYFSDHSTLRICAASTCFIIASHLTLVGTLHLYDEFERLEESYATSSGFVERATHLCSWRAADQPRAGCRPPPPIKLWETSSD